MYINKVALLGNLTRDPELKSLPNGTKVARIGLATNRTWKDQNGQKQEAVEYHNVVVFGKQAEVIDQWVKKGHQLYVEGRLSTSSWDDQTTGKKMYRTEVILENFQFGNKPQSGNNNSPAGENSPDPKDAPKYEDNLGSIDYGDAVNVDDIPF